MELDFRVLAPISIYVFGQVANMGTVQHSFCCQNLFLTPPQKQCSRDTWDDPGLTERALISSCSCVREYRRKQQVFWGTCTGEVLSASGPSGGGLHCSGGFAEDILVHVVIYFMCSTSGRDQGDVCGSLPFIAGSSLVALLNYFCCAVRYEFAVPLRYIYMVGSL